VARRLGVERCKQSANYYGHRVTTPTLTGLGKRSHVVLDAVGVRIADLPITPEKVLAALDRQKSTTK